MDRRPYGQSYSTGVWPFFFLKQKVGWVDARAPLTLVFVLALTSAIALVLLMAIVLVSALVRALVTELVHVLVHSAIALVLV